MRTVPYKTKSGLLIGSRWDPPHKYPPMSLDMERLQEALLRRKVRMSLLDITTWAIGVLVLLGTFAVALII